MIRSFSKVIICSQSPKPPEPYKRPDSFEHMIHPEAIPQKQRKEPFSRPKAKEKLYDELYRSEKTRKNADSKAPQKMPPLAPAIPPTDHRDTKRIYPKNLTDHPEFIYPDAEYNPENPLVAGSAHTSPYDDTGDVYRFNIPSSQSSTNELGDPEATMTNDFANIKINEEQMFSNDDEPDPTEGLALNADSYEFQLPTSLDSLHHKTNKSQFRVPKNLNSMIEDPLLKRHKKRATPSGELLEESGSDLHPIQDIGASANFQITLGDFINSLPRKKSTGKISPTILSQIFEIASYNAKGRKIHPTSHPILGPLVLFYEGKIPLIINKEGQTEAPDWFNTKIDFTKFSPEAADRLLQIMNAHGISPRLYDQNSISDLMDATAKTNQAIELARNVKEPWMTYCGLTDDEVAIEYLISGVVDMAILHMNNGKSHKALHIFQKALMARHLLYQTIIPLKFELTDGGELAWLSDLFENVNFGAALRFSPEGSLDPAQVAVEEEIPNTTAQEILSLLEEFHNQEVKENKTEFNLGDLVPRPEDFLGSIGSTYSGNTPDTAFDPKAQIPAVTPAAEELINKHRKKSEIAAQREVPQTIEQAHNQNYWAPQIEFHPLCKLHPSIIEITVLMAEAYQQCDQPDLAGFYFDASRNALLQSCRLVNLDEKWSSSEKANRASLNKEYLQIAEKSTKKWVNSTKRNKQFEKAESSLKSGRKSDQKTNFENLRRQFMASQLSFFDIAVASTDTQKYLLKSLEANFLIEAAAKGNKYWADRLTTEHLNTIGLYSIQHLGNLSMKIARVCVSTLKTQLSLLEKQKKIQIIAAGDGSDGTKSSDINNSSLFYQSFSDTQDPQKLRSTSSPSVAALLKQVSMDPGEKADTAFRPLSIPFPPTFDPAHLDVIINFDLPSNQSDNLSDTLSYPKTRYSSGSHHYPSEFNIQMTPLELRHQLTRDLGNAWYKYALIIWKRFEQLAKLRKKKLVQDFENLTKYFENQQTMMHLLVNHPEHLNGLQQFSEQALQPITNKLQPEPNQGSEGTNDLQPTELENDTMNPMNPQNAPDIAEMIPGSDFDQMSKSRRKILGLRMRSIMEYQDFLSTSMVTLNAALKNSRNEWKDLISEYAQSLPKWWTPAPILNPDAKTLAFMQESKRKSAKTALKIFKASIHQLDKYEKMFATDLKRAIRNYEDNLYAQAYQLFRERQKKGISENVDYKAYLDPLSQTTKHNTETKMTTDLYKIKKIPLFRPNDPSTWKMTFRNTDVSPKYPELMDPTTRSFYEQEKRLKKMELNTPFIFDPNDESDMEQTHMHDPSDPNASDDQRKQFPLDEEDDYERLERIASSLSFQKDISKLDEYRYAGQDDDGFVFGETSMSKYLKEQQDDYQQDMMNLFQNFQDNFEHDITPILDEAAQERRRRVQLAIQRQKTESAKYVDADSKLDEELEKTSESHTEEMAISNYLYDNLWQVLDEGDTQISIDAQQALPPTTRHIKRLALLSILDPNFHFCNIPLSDLGHSIEEYTIDKSLPAAKPTPAQIRTQSVALYGLLTIAEPQLTIKAQKATLLFDLAAFQFNNASILLFPQSNSSLSSGDADPDPIQIEKLKRESIQLAIDALDEYLLCYPPKVGGPGPCSAFNLRSEISLLEAHLQYVTQTSTKHREFFASDSTAFGGEHISQNAQYIQHSFLEGNEYESIKTGLDMLKQIAGFLEQIGLYQESEQWMTQWKYTMKEVIIALSPQDILQKSLNDAKIAAHQT